MEENVFEEVAATTKRTRRAATATLLGYWSHSVVCLSVCLWQSVLRL